MRPGIVYDLNGAEWLCEDIKPDGSVFLKAVKASRGTWACCHGQGSAAHLRFEYNARPVQRQTIAKIRLWGSWNVMPRLRRIRKAVTA